jgi:hypothetical protein
MYKVVCIVKSPWGYLYGIVDKHGQTIDCPLTDECDE